MQRFVEMVCCTDRCSEDEDEVIVCQCLRKNINPAKEVVSELEASQEQYFAHS